jgi:hypothetical protein
MTKCKVCGQEGHDAPDLGLWYTEDFGSKEVYERRKKAVKLE